MTDELDGRIRQLLSKIEGAAPRPHDWSTIEDRRPVAPPQRNVLVPVLGAAVIVAIVVAVAVVSGRNGEERVASVSAPATTAVAVGSSGFPLDRLIAAVPADTAEGVFLTDFAAVRAAGAVTDELVSGLPYLSRPAPPGSTPTLRDALPSAAVEAAVTYGITGLATPDGPESASVLVVNVSEDELGARLVEAGYVDEGDGWFTTEVTASTAYATVILVVRDVVVLGQQRPFVESAVARLSAGSVDPELVEAIAQTSAPDRAIGTLEDFQSTMNQGRCPATVVQGRDVDGRVDWAVNAGTGWARESASTSDEAAAVLVGLADQVCAGQAPGTAVPQGEPGLSTDTSSLLGRWIVTTESADALYVPYFDLAADGRISGFDGCVPYLATWTFDGANVFVKRLPTPGGSATPCDQEPASAPAGRLSLAAGTLTIDGADRPAARRFDELRSPNNPLPELRGRWAAGGARLVFGDRATVSLGQCTGEWEALGGRLVVSGVELTADCVGGSDKIPVEVATVAAILTAQADVRFDDSGALLLSGRDRIVRLAPLE